MRLLAGAVVLACVAVPIAPSAVAEAADEETTAIRTQVINALSVKEVWHSHEAASFYSKHSVFVAFRQSAYENMPVDGEWESPGVLMFGLGDIDETPFAVRIWTKGEDRFLEDLSRKETESGENGVALFGPSEDDVRLRITARPYREVLIGEETIGWIDGRGEE